MVKTTIYFHLMKYIQQSHRNRVARSNQQLTWSCWQRFKTSFVMNLSFVVLQLHEFTQRSNGSMDWFLKACFAQLLAVLLGSGEGVPDVANVRQKSEASHLKGLVHSPFEDKTYLSYISIRNMFKQIYVTSPQRPPHQRNLLCKNTSQQETPKTFGVKYRPEFGWAAL